ncbi:DUF2147 domain-containing protein [Rhodovulum sp. DZ06]|uniref:DUF2147 domain-containing protein n=1 Tax=Rhodovulum sp. DZ06 TaxID=3425126 RepID=UPI003D3501FF
MIRTACAGALVAAALAAPAFAADPVHGLWKTEANDAGRYLHVRVGPCEADPALTCGVIDSAHGGADDSIVGRRMIHDMKPEGGGKYDDGKIWAPDDDKTYSANMELDGADLLKVEGCVFIICRGQDWTRVK